MISDRQNTEINIQRLAAQRYLYSRAKRLHFIRLILTLPTILILSIIVALLKSKQITSSVGIQPYDASWLLALASLVVFVLDRFIFEPVQQEQKAAAVAIQEEFDCDVLQIPRNDIELPKRPVRERIISNARHYLTRYGPDKLYNWYACPGDNLIPLSAARVICQRSNVSYDASLRQRYILTVLICGFVVSIGVVAVSVAHDLSLRGLLSSVIAPLLPIAGFVVGEIRQNRAAIQTLEDIRDCIEEQWDAVLSRDLRNNDLVHKSRQLQDRIYANRKGSTLIPDWLYEKLRTSNEALMEATAEQMKQQYLAQQEPGVDADKPRCSG
jgi:hypothetical protein